MTPNEPPAVVREGSSPPPPPQPKDPSLNLSQRPLMHVINEPPHVVGPRNERTAADRLDPRPHVVLRAGEGMGAPARALARLLLELAGELLVREGQHAAVGVVDEDDLLGA